MIPYTRKTSPYSIMSAVQSFLLIDANSFLLIDDDGSKLLLKEESGSPFTRLTNPYTKQSTPFTRKTSPYTQQ